MPDQNVDVTFDPNAKPQFTFVEPSVRMTEAGKVIFHKRPASARWRFLDGEVKRDTLNQFSSTVPGEGDILHIDDEFLDERKTTYEYRVIVELDGKTFPSPDPVIVNDPGSK